VTVPTVLLGFFCVVFCSIDIAGDKPSILSTSKSSISSTSKYTPSKSALSKSTPSKSQLSRTSRSSRLSRSSRFNRAQNSVFGGLPKPLIPIIYDFESLHEKRKTKKKKTVDFLGNTRTDHIVGLFKRKEIISGDKASAKQLRKDKKWKPGKKKRRNVKNRPKSFSQRIGIINKGFKI